MNNEFKIRKMLGNNYHLNVNDDGENISWKLFRKYSDWELYMSNDNPAIMTSENNTEEELYKFAKDHCLWNEIRLINSLATILLLINMVVVLLNIFIFKEPIVSYLTCCTSIILLIISVALFEISNHNCKVEWKIICEDFKRKYDKNDLH